MPSIIGADLKVVGNLQCDGDIDVQGTVQGDIEAATVTVDKDARIEGSIRAHSLIVSGSVDGGMEATEISLTSTARVTGELTHETLSVDPGASLEARLSRLTKEKKIAAQIPKPKLKIPEVEPPAARAAESETPAAEATEEKPLATETADTADTGETDAPEPENTDIPEVFDRRKKQATG
jgi:cytoskeletal protein CcmA (bactofilin family)